MPEKNKALPIHDKNGRPMPVAAKDDMAFRNFTDALDLNDLKTALYHQEDGSNYRQLLDFMSDPAYKRYTISSLARMCKVSLADLMTLMRDKAVAEGTIRMMSHLPQVMEDVGEDARSQWITCPRCDGAGEMRDERMTDETVALTHTCPECKGRKVIRKAGDKHARDLMFETAGMINKKGPLVAQQFNNFSATAGLKAMTHEVHRLLEDSEPEK